MRTLIIRKEQGNFLIGHEGSWLGRWKEDFRFNNICSLLEFIQKGIFISIKWEYPEPTFEVSDKTYIKDISVNRIFLHTHIILKDIDTSSADLCFVYDDKENIFKVVDKPYDDFAEPFKSNNCLPCWSVQAIDKYKEAIEEFNRKEDEKIRVRTRYFVTSEDYENWRNEHSYVKILEFRETWNPCSEFRYEVTYEYRNIDKKGASNKS